MTPTTKYQGKYGGVVVPMVSPFTADGRIDGPSVKKIVDYLAAARVAGIFPLGTTGESVSIHADDKRRLIELTVTHTAKRSMVYAGISSNCLRESVELSQFAKSAGVDAVVAHPPSYYPLSDREIETYLFKLADASALPLVLYNIPQTTKLNIPVDSVLKLSKHPSIVALKDSSPDRERIETVVKACGGRNGFPVLLGNSSLFTHGLKAGGVGIIPSGAHLVGPDYQALFEAAMNDDWERVESLQARTDAACAAYLKGNSIAQGLAALKAILHERGLCTRHVLPPLIEHER